MVLKKLFWEVLQLKIKIFLKDACLKFPGKIALGLDAKDGKLSVSGWKESSNISTLEFLKRDK